MFRPTGNEVHDISSAPSRRRSFTDMPRTIVVLTVVTGAAFAVTFLIYQLTTPYSWVWDNFQDANPVLKAVMAADSMIMLPIWGYYLWKHVFWRLTSIIVLVLCVSTFIGCTFGVRM